MDSEQGSDEATYEQEVAVALSNPHLKKSQRQRLKSGELSLTVVKALQTYEPDAHQTEAINQAIAFGGRAPNSPPPLTLASAPPTIEILRRAGVAEAMIGLLEDIVNDKTKLAQFAEDLNDEERLVFGSLLSRLNTSEQA